MIKDVLSIKLWLLATFVISMIVYFILFILFISPYSKNIDTLTWNPTIILSIYGLAIFINMVSFLISYAKFYAAEINKGTIRSLSLYPLNMNDITIAKILSSAIVASIASTMIFFSIIGPFMFAGAYSIDGVLLIQFSAILASIFILTTAAFGSHVIIYFLGSIKISGNALNTIMFTISFFFTENMIVRLGEIFRFLNPNVDMASVSEVSKALAQFSPFHSTGRFISNSLLATGYGLDLHFILPIGLITIILGYVFGRKIHLDIFLKE